MIISIIIALATIFIGPFMFWYISHVVYSNSNLNKYPTQLHDFIGDLIFLPLFNGFLASTIIDFNHTFSFNIMLLSLVISLVFTFAYVYYQINIAHYLDWSKPKMGKLNFGGIYHSVFMFVQVTLIFYGLIVFYSSYLLWICVLGYLIITGVQFLKEGRI